ncbi:alpha/beta fold hydrolase [Knoellia aerolata]|uniref:AB hydrolase-1 domain-containing protein n=1 Tax=Knoellia aerolata DSM 18566 TaxID=1385519 RepID=A0A0A0K374_9MICO|nr:alpha/beta hydrolase [Knoellia aerolata]KGN42231.1 hypothetical protein N801_01440 [Knoellia aerolata DSM 18566]
MSDLYRSPAHARQVREWCRRRLGVWDVPHDTDHVETSLGRTHLTWAGAPGDVVCLYLPGTNVNAAVSTTVLTELSGRFRVVCADLPGQPGLSAAGRPPDEVAGYGRWTGEVVRHVRHRHPRARLVLMGHSRGAAAALSVDPPDVDALVLVSPAGLARVRLTPLVLRRSTAWLLRPSPARSRRLVDLMAGASGDPGLEPMVDWMTVVARCTRTTGAPGPLPSDVLDRWRGRPVRILAGALDVFFRPARLAEAAVRIGARLDVVEDAGHLLVDQRPDLVATAVTELV